MPQNVDHVADKSRAEMVRLARLYPFPDFVKQASMEATFEPGRQLVTIYADPVRRQFPCHTAASTWLSHLYYREKRAEFHPKDQAQIEKRLANYAGYFRIRPACDAIVTRWNELHKTAEEQLPDSDFAYVWVGDDGRKDRRLRLKTAAEVKAAAEYLHQYRDRFTFPQRHTMAQKILEKAAHHGAAVRDHYEFLERQAGRGVCNPPEVVELIRQRGLLVKDAALKQCFTKMAEEVAQKPRQFLAPDVLVKLAETLDQLDRQQGFVQHYQHGMQRPEDVIFKATFEKAASELQSKVATTSGKVYEKSAFARLKLADVEALFGDDFARQVRTPLGDVDPEKMAEHAHALPRPDAELLDGLLSDSGVSPLLVKAASARQGLTADEQRHWAAAYQTVG
jgi:hypothetical protein